MNVVLSLTEDHIAITGMLQQALIKKTLDDNILQKICDALLFHLEMEEIVFDSLQGIPEIQDAVCLALQDHASIRHIVREIFQYAATYRLLHEQIACHLGDEEADTFMSALSQGEMGSNRMFAYVQDLLETFQRGAAAEEKAIFPKMPRMLPDPLLVQLSQQFEDALLLDNPCERMDDEYLTKP